MYYFVSSGPVVTNFPVPTVPLVGSSTVLSPTPQGHCFYFVQCTFRGNLVWIKVKMHDILLVFMESLWLLLSVKHVIVADEQERRFNFMIL